MPFPKDINQYVDVKRILETARLTGGGRFTVETRAQAVNWRARAYTYRKLLAKNQLLTHAIGHIPSTPWDDMKLKIDAADPLTVVITFGEVGGTLSGPSGEAVKLVAGTPDLKPQVAASDDPLLAAALELAGDDE